KRRNVIERKHGDKERHGKPDSRQTGVPDQRRPTDIVGKFRNSGFDRDKRGRGNAQRLANDQPGHYPQRDFGMLDRSADPNSGIGKREQGHYHESREIVERVLDPQTGRGHALTGVLLSLARQENKVSRFLALESI